jgi:hypothetical protein
MSVWDWIEEFAAEASASGDEERLKLWQAQMKAFGHGKENPDAMLAALDEGRALARQLNESWWVLHFDHWRLQALLHYKLDYREVLDLAVQATLEARKPQYAQLPQRICLHEDLIYAYLGIDPLGNADAIRRALDYMRTEVTEDLDCRYCVQNCRTEFALLCGQLQEAEESARLTLTMADEDVKRSTAEHHAAYAHCDLCEIAHRRQDWDALREWAAEGEALARRTEEHLKVAEFLLWQAFLARLEGDEEAASRRQRQALARSRRVKALPGTNFYNILSAFHERGGELERALAVRDLELKRLQDKGRLHDECRCRVKRCRLLAQMGRPLDEELAAAEQAARKLRDPAPHLAELERIARGERGG